jgi:hypothetical protein
MHAPASARVVVEGTVLRAAIVPDRHRSDFPAKPAGVFRLHRMRLQELDDWPRFGGRKALQGFGVAADV